MIKDIINPEVDKYCNMLYFWKGKPTCLGRLSNYQLESIIKFINKYPNGSLNGYTKQTYIEAVNSILRWRDYDICKFDDIINIRRLQRAEKFFDELIVLIVKAKLNTEKQQLKTLNVC